MPRNPTPLGVALKMARARKSMSQEAVSGLVGVSPNYISRIECGDVDPRWELVAKLCKALGLTRARLDSIVLDVEATREENEVSDG